MANSGIFLLKKKGILIILSGMKEKSGKRYRLNSIKDPEIKRILKPCEARAGHGTIIILVAYSIIGGALFGFYKLIRWLIDIISG